MHMKLKHAWENIEKRELTNQTVIINEVYKYAHKF